MAQLTSYSYSKQFLLERDLLTSSPFTTSVVCSIVAGALAVIVMAPFDVVSTRIYNQGWLKIIVKSIKTLHSFIDCIIFLGLNEHGKGLLYTGYCDCLAKIWRTEGFFGFYKGLGACYVRLGSHTVLSLTFWDQFKDLYDRFKSIEQPY